MALHNQLMLIQPIEVEQRRKKFMEFQMNHQIERIKEATFATATTTAGDFYLNVHNKMC